MNLRHCVISTHLGIYKLNFHTGSSCFSLSSIIKIHNTYRYNGSTQYAYLTMARRYGALVSFLGLHINPKLCNTFIKLFVTITVIIMYHFNLKTSCQHVNKTSFYFIVTREQILFGKKHVKLQIRKLNSSIFHFLI